MNWVAFITFWFINDFQDQFYPITNGNSWIYKIDTGGKKLLILPEPWKEKIIGYVEKINELDTEKIIPSDHIGGVKNVLRNDTAGSTIGEGVL